MIIFILALASAFGLQRFLPGNMGRIEKFLITPSLGLIVFGSCSLYISFLKISGLNNLLLTIAVAALVNLFLFKNELGKIARYRFVAGDLFKKDKLFLIFLSAITIIFGITIINQTLLPTKNGLQTGGGGMYGDSALHAAYTSKLLEGQFPPDNPLFAGHVLVYPYANDLLSSDLIMSGLNYNLAFSLPQIIFFAGFITLFYCFAKKLLGDRWAILPIVIFLLGWGVGFMSYVEENITSGFTTFNIQREYTHNDQLNLNLHNPITGLILPERSFLPGLVIGLLAIVLLDEFFKKRLVSKSVIIGILVGILPFWHTHTFIFISLYAFFIITPRLLKRETAFVKDLAIIFVSSLPFIFPFLYLFLANKEAGSFLHYTFGWMANGQNLLIYWLRNAFLVLPLAVTGLFLRKRNLADFYGVFLIFFISNFAIFQPWDWDNIKLITWCFLFFSILASLSILHITRLFKVGFVSGWLIVVVSCLSGLLSIALQLRNEYIAYDNYDLELANWVKQATKKDDVFIIEPNPTHPVPGLTGRSVYMGYQGHLWVHGIRYSGRERLNVQIMNGDWSGIDNTDIQINYVVMPAPGSIENIPLRPQVFSNNKYMVFKVN